MENLLSYVAAGISGDKRKFNRFIAAENVKKAEFNLKKAELKVLIFKARLIIANRKYEKINSCTQLIESKNKDI